MIIRSTFSRNLLLLMVCAVVLLLTWHDLAIAANEDSGTSESAARSETDQPPVSTQPAVAAPASRPASEQPERALRTFPHVPDPKLVGGESKGVVRVANLVYMRNKTSRCFSDHFLQRAEEKSSISTSRRFHATRLNSDEMFNFPLVVMTGEGGFKLSDQERKNLRDYVMRGGFLLASAGCSSSSWDRSFRKEMTAVFPKHALKKIDMKHPVFHLVYEVNTLKTKHGRPRPLEAIHFGGRMGVLYSSDGLNDTSHAKGCCCCGGNEITNAIEINVNVLAYALLY
jgi:hypothetical protein